jgi:hypothetical protein
LRWWRRIVSAVVLGRVGRRRILLRHIRSCSRPFTKTSRAENIRSDQEAGDLRPQRRDKDDWDLGNPVGWGRRREDCLTFVVGEKGNEGNEMSQGYRDVTSSYGRGDESNHTGDASIARSRRGKRTQEDPNW